MGEWEPNSTHMLDSEGAEPLFPGDFSTDEIAFAEELRAMFPVECEELPPYYISTLATAERYAPLVSGYEHRVLYRVFRRLRLPRMPIFGEVRGWLGDLSWSSVLDTLAHTSRPLLGAMSAAMMLMTLMVVMASPSFAQGVLLIFGQTGVRQVQTYPRHVSAAPVTSRPGPPASPQPVGIQLSWLGNTAGQYVYQGVVQLPQQSWSAGPIMDLEYSLSGPTNGTGMLDIREFQLASTCAAVLQVVQANYAQETLLADGTAAVFVDGSWENSGSGHVWTTGEQNKLLFERNGVLFWLSADPRDGMDENALVAVANNLTLAQTPLHALNQPGVASIARYLAASLENFFAGELYYVVPVGLSPQTGIGTYVLMQGRSNSSMY